MKANRLITVNPWQHITAAVKRRPHGCSIAVAYFGIGAARMLPLTRGSTLVVDMSKRAVCSGQTCPAEVLKLVTRGVDVHSVHNLHAKVFVAGDRAIVGSTNVSSHSAKALIEAVVGTRDRQVVAGCREFVRSLRGELVTPAYARRMQKLYRPPKFGTPGGRRGGSREQPVSPSHAPLWVAPLEYVSWDDSDRHAEEQGWNEAERRMKSKKQFHIENFVWPGRSFPPKLQKDHLLIQLTDEGDGRTLLSPPARVLSVRHYRVGRGTRVLVFLELPTGLRRKNLGGVIKRLGQRTRKLKRMRRPQAVRHGVLAHSLLNLWPKPGGKVV